MDTIYTNGVIHTLDGRTVDALAVERGRLAYVGTGEAALSLAGPGTQVVDLQGRCVLPGFTDSHMHLLLTGLSRDKLDLTGVRSVEEIVARGRAFIAQRQLPPGTWVLGRGFDHNLFTPPLLPDGAVAQAISAEHPVLLDRVCGHVGAANAPALQAVGFDAGTVIPGGVLDRDESGRLTGILREAALDQLKARMPAPTQTDAERCLLRAGQDLASCGVTAVHSDDVLCSGADWPTLSAACRSLSARGAMPLRLYEEVECARPDVLRDFLAQGLKTGDGDDWFRVCNVKLLTDGSLGARTARLREDYADAPGNRGIPVYTQSELGELVAMAHAAGLQVAFHAIGDGALEQCVVAVERAMARDPKPLRHRIVHCQIGDAALYRRMAALGMGADVQPPFTASDWTIASGRLGPRRLSGSYAWKTLLDLGVRLGGGSDSPVEPFAPLWGIHCAVNRTDKSGQPAGGWLPDQRLTTAQAVALYTTGPAWLSNSEAHAGTLTAGKYADFVVLDRDIFSVPPEEIRDLKVCLTVAGGRVTYQADGL